MDRVIEKQGFWRKYRWHLLAGALILAIGVWLLFSNSANSMRVDAGSLTISKAEYGEFNDYVRLSTTVVPIQVVHISPEEGGIVVERVAEEGQALKKGDVIVRISNSSLDLQILNAESELAEKQNILRNTQIQMQQDRLSNQTEQATLDVDLRRKERAYKQNERLYGDKLIASEVFLQSKEDYELVSKKQELVSERLRQDSIYRSVQMSQIEDNLQNMRKNVLMVRERKAKLEVRSTIDGELGLLDVEIGQSIQPGQKIGQINDLSNFKLEARIDEHYIDRVAVGLTATIERDGETYELRVRKVYPEVRDGKFRTDFVFVDRRPENIRSGQTYYLNLQLGTPSEAVIIPKGTFFQTTGGNWLYVIAPDGSTAYRRSIKIGRQNPLYYEVEEGIQPGESVITSGYEAFKDYEELKLR